MSAERVVAVEAHDAGVEHLCDGQVFTASSHDACVYEPGSSPLCCTMGWPVTVQSVTCPTPPAIQFLIDRGDAVIMTSIRAL
jgi:hypothetical protein